MKFLISLILLFCWILTQGKMYGQGNLSFVPSSEITIKIGPQIIKNPFAGGLNYAQFSTIDIDFDNDLDLVAFDRSFNELRCFENTSVSGNPQYVFRIDWENKFPSGMRYRLFCADYDNDGKKDLFTYGIGGIKVYRNTGNIGNGLSFVVAKEILTTKLNNISGTLYCASSDIPAIVDVDFDGDIDVLSFHIGGERIEYHQNQSQELYGHSDSLVFEIKNECWGKFLEDPNNNNVILNATAFPCEGSVIGQPQKSGIANSGPTRHAGSTILALDYNNNGVYDLILGDVAATNLVYLQNSGTAPNQNSPMTSQVINFPSNSTPVNINLFPGTYFEDIDFDGKKDLLVTPNARNLSENQKSVWMYKNTGTTSLPTFQFQQTDFLQAEMIDHGTGSVPVMFDQNGDGKRDLLLSHLFRYKPILEKESAFLTYRNTGTNSTPEFTFHSNDYLNLSQQSLGFRPIPSFGDLDNDGDQDMIVGKEDGSLAYYQNTAGPNLPCAFNFIGSLNNSSNQAISVSSYAFPQLFDLENDGKLDLFIGTKDGQIVYYKNNGTSSYSFDLMDNTFGNVDLSTSSDDYMSPHFFRNNGFVQLFAGGFDGKLHFYDSITEFTGLNDTFPLVSDAFLGINTGAYSSFWVEDIDNDGNLNLFIGQDLGGLYSMEVDPNSSVELQEKDWSFQIIPNPAISVFHIQSSEKIEQVQVYDLNGKLLISSMELSEGISIETLSSGMYILSVKSDNRLKLERLIKF